MTADESVRLLRLRRLAVLDTGAEALFDAYTRIAAQVCGRPIALISLVDAERQWFKSAIGLPQGGETPRTVAFCDHTIRGDALFEVPDTLDDPRFHSNPLVTGAPFVRHYAGMPLVMPEGERIGTLCVIGHEPGSLTPGQRQLLAELATAVTESLLQREREIYLGHATRSADFQALAEDSPVGIFHADAQGRITYTNGKWQHFFGLDLPRSLGTSWLDVVHAADAPGVASTWAEAVRVRRPFDLTFRLAPAGGRERWVRCRARPSRSSDARDAEYVGAVMDVTRARCLEAELRSKNALLQDILEHLPCGLTVFDSELQLLLSNRLFRRQFDLPDELFDAERVDFHGLAMYLAQRGEYGPGDPAQLVRERELLPVGRQAHRFERTRPDGSVLEARGVPTPSGHFVTTYNDVTQQRSTAEALRLSQDRLQRALDASDLALWEYDVRSRRVYLSESWSRMLGTAAGPTHTTIDALAALVPQEDQMRMNLAISALVGQHSERYAVEHRVRRPDGGIIWIQSEGRVSERSSEGRAVRIVGTNRDITARKQAETEMREARASADAANRAKSDFLATISHEIRTPLSGVLGLTRLLQREPLAPRQAEYAQMILGSAESLLVLINDVLDYSKIEAGRLTLESRPFDLRALLHEQHQMHHLRASEKSLVYTTEIAPEVPEWIEGDVTRLRQVLGNLLGNAVKFTQRGSVCLRAGVAGGRLRFEVQDTGIGIAPEQQGRLFARFSQADASTTREFGGTGLGLAIVRDLCQLMGGTVTLRSDHGTGSTFAVELPLRPAQPVAPPPALVHAAVQPTRARVLVVEDNPTNQVVARGLLSHLGIADVTLAGDGEQALQCWRDAAFDIVFMDCQMPVMDGYQATMELRRRGCRVPIVAMTASAIAGDRERCIAAGMDDYLTKPVDPKALEAVLSRLLAADTAPAAATRAVRGPAAQGAAAGMQDGGSEPAEPLFDAAGTLVRFMGDAELLALALDACLAQAPRLMARLRTDLSAGDAAAAREAAHSLKGACGTVGAARAAAQAQAMELHLAQGELESARARLAPLEAAVAGFEAQARAQRGARAAQADTAVC